MTKHDFWTQLDYKPECSMITYGRDLGNGVMIVVRCGSETLTSQFVSDLTIRDGRLVQKRTKVGSDNEYIYVLNDMLREHGWRVRSVDDTWNKDGRDILTVIADDPRGCTFTRNVTLVHHPHDPRTLRTIVDTFRSSF